MNKYISKNNIIYSFTVKSYPTIDGEVTGTNMTFVEFNIPNNCGHKSYLIGNNPLSPDAVHPLQLRNVHKLSVSNDSLVFYYDPDPDWIVQEVRTTEVII